MIALLIAATVSALILAIAGLWLTRNASRSQFTLLRDSLEGFQRTLVVQQEQTSRSQEERAASLRTELAQTLQANRQEQQAGLLQASQGIETRLASMDTRLDGRLKEMTHGVQTKLEANLKEGFLHFEKIQIHLKQAEAQLQGLNTVGQGINQLNRLLQMPHLRGGFGEATLERLLADFLPQESYELQYCITPGSTERVDAVIRHPGALLPIDSKFPREQVLPLFETQEPAALDRARKALSDVIKSQAKSVRDKYIHPEHGTTDMALLFVPSETLYFEILRDSKLCEDLGKLKVFAVSPNTLAVTLHAVSSAQRYYEMARGVEKTILEVKKAQQHFESFEKRFEDVGNSLNKAQTSFHMAATHLSRYTGAVTRLTGSLETEPSAEPPKLREGEVQAEA